VEERFLVGVFTISILDKAKFFIFTLTINT